MPYFGMRRQGAGTLGPLAFVVVAGLEEVNLIVPCEVDDAVLLRQPARPRVGGELLQCFRLANPLEGVSEYRLDYVEGA